MKLLTLFVLVTLLTATTSEIKEGDTNKQVGQPAELSAWAYAYRADLKVQEKPEANFVLRRLERLDQVYRPVSLLLSQVTITPSEWGTKYKHVLIPNRVGERGPLLPASIGVLQSALLWEEGVQLNRLELHWPKNGVPPQENVEVRVYPWTKNGWFSWQWDQQVTVKPEISGDGSTWVFNGNWNEVDMVAVFVQPGGEKTKGQVNGAVPQIRAYGPEQWERMDVEIEWGFKEGTEKADFSGRVEGFFGLVDKVAPFKGDPGTALDGTNAWKSQASGGKRRGISISLLYIEPKTPELSSHPRDTRITVWTVSGNFTFLVKDLVKGPILAPEYGFFVTKAGSGKAARRFESELTAANVRSIREMTREHSEATWEEAMREIKLPLLPPGTTLPPYGHVEDPPMQIVVPEAQWMDAWRKGVSILRNGPLSFMTLALEAARPIHAMNVVGLHDTAAGWLDTFLQRPGAASDGDFSDGAGNFHEGKLFHETGLMDVPGYPAYELIHNGGTGRILYDLAEHYFLTGDTRWFKKNQWRMQAAAEWIIRQRTLYMMDTRVDHPDRNPLYMKDTPNRNDLWVAGLHPPQMIGDMAAGHSQWYWYAVIDAWYCQGLRRFAEAMVEVDSNNAGKYLSESEQYRKALQKAVERAITFSPVIKVRNGTYRSYIPPIFYIRGRSVNQYTFFDMDMPLVSVDSEGIPAANDIRVDGHLDVCEDNLALNFNRQRKERGLSSGEDWFWSGIEPQLGYGYLANVYLRRDEVSSFLRQWVNNYAVFVDPMAEYFFSEHSTSQFQPAYLEKIKDPHHILAGCRSSHSLTYFMEQFRSLLVWEDGNVLWLAKATPRHWLEQGKKISVSKAPTYFGTVSFAILSDVDNGKITATVEMPSRNPAKEVWLRLRHPKSAPIKNVTVNGKGWKDFDPARETIKLTGVTGNVAVLVSY